MKKRFSEEQIIGLHEKREECLKKIRPTCDDIRDAEMARVGTVPVDNFQTCMDTVVKSKNPGVWAAKAAFCGALAALTGDHEMI